MPIVNRLADFHADMTAWRRHIHAHPELGYEEHETSAFVASKLESFGIAVTRGLAGTGIVGTLEGRGGAGDGRAIGLRADMDALPMTEENTFAHVSTRPGRMHACGHDGHTAMLLGAARYLAENPNFTGKVHFIFQPAEEGGAGGERMIADGLFRDFPMAQVFGMHNWPQLPAGTVGVRPGAMMASADQFKVTIAGRGGHAAMPHFTVDPVLVGAQIVTAVQSIVARNVNPLDQGVVSVTMFHAGSASNVIASTAELQGTVRAYSPTVRDLLQARFEAVCRQIAAAFDAEVEIDYERGYPPTINSAAEAELSARVAEEIVGAGNVLRDVEPSMGAEDFAYMLEKRPGAYIFMGQAGGPSACMVHNTRYDFNDEILPLGASYWVKLVETALPL